MANKIYMLGEDPGNINDLLVPMARVFYVPQNPEAMVKSIGEMPYRLGGRAVKPNQPVIMRNPDGSTSILPGFGVTETAELQDLAYRNLEKKNQDWRERFGFPDRASFDARLREHMDWRSKHPNDHPQPMSQLERENRRRSIPLA